MMVFGGRDTTGNNLNDVWILTNANGLGGTSQWINLIANGSSGSPAARSGHSAAYDSTNNILIIFGGCSGACAPVLNDVWVLSNANGLGGTPVWTQLSLSGGVGPAGRTNSAVAYDAASINCWFWVARMAHRIPARPYRTFGSCWMRTEWELPPGPVVPLSGPYRRNSR